MDVFFSDERGKLFFPIKNNIVPFDDIKECTVSCNKKNVFRGLHINKFDKLITCIKGKILDIIINFDKFADDYLIPKYITLDPCTAMYQLFIPKNFAHGFISLEEDSILIYHFNGTYLPENTQHIHFLDPFINLTLPVSKNQLIISKNDDVKHFVKPIDYLIFGANGFLGTYLQQILKSENKNYIINNIRLSEVDKMKELINLYSPKYIINCAGISGDPNIFWCDNNKIETIETNITYQLTLANICKEKNIHLTIFGSGGIFQNDKFYRENDSGNNFNNFYGECRIYLENIVKNYDNVLYLRINYPICDKKYNKNLLTKLLTYNSIDSFDISISYIDNLFPILLKMIENHEIGICNFTNPGSISLENIIKKYQEISNTVINYSVEVNTLTKRSSSKLETDILNKYTPLNIEQSVELCIKNYISNLAQS